MLYITGITGHSGRWFLKRLETEGYLGKIRCVVRDEIEKFPAKYSILENSDLDLDCVVGDLNDENFLSKSMFGVNTLIHIAGIFFSPKVMAAAIENKVERVILVHTTGRFSKYKSASAEYAKIEDDILNNCSPDEQGGQIIACTILRPTMIYGSSQDHNMYRLVEYLDKHSFFPLFGNGKNLMQPVHARDLGNAYYDVLVHPETTIKKNYNLSGKDPITYLEIIKIIQKILNSKLKIIPLPISFSIFAVKLYNALFKNAIITVEQVMRMQEDKAFSHKEASKDFGYHAISFEEGIREEVLEYLSKTRIDYLK